MITPTYCVLVNWNLREDTLACVDSLIKAGQPAEQIIVVDNDSNDGSVIALQARYGEALWIIENAENVGFASAANQGAGRALTAGAEWIFLLNNDTVVDPDIFTAFERARRDYPHFRILAPLILFFDPPEKVWFFGDRLRGKTLVTTSLYKGQSRNQPMPEVTAVDFVNGCGMFVHREVYKKVGFFDESLFMYGEEVDFCWRARAKGFQSASISTAVMWHKVSRSAERVKPEMRYFRIRNQITFYRRYARGLVLPVMFGFTLLRILGIGVRDLLNQQAELIRPMVRGWTAGWFAKPQAPNYGNSNL
jgi:GT2 family glycosyltransferase